MDAIGGIRVRLHCGTLELHCRNLAPATADLILLLQSSLGTPNRSWLVQLQRHLQAVLGDAFCSDENHSGWRGVPHPDAFPCQHIPCMLGAWRQDSDTISGLCTFKRKPYDIHAKRP